MANIEERHWTILIQVEEVLPKQPIRDGSGRPTVVNAGGGQTIVAQTERRVIERFKTVVASESEAEAYRKAIALMEINRPEPVETVELRGDDRVVAKLPRPIRDAPQA